MRILVTGGAGYLGSHVVEQLLALGASVTVLDDLTCADEYRGAADFALGDVRDVDRLRRLVSEADLVVWLAAIVGDAACELDPARAISVNVHAVGALAEMDRPILFTSSCSAYGALLKEADEGAPLSPRSLYAETKVEAERLLRPASAVILRLGTLHGASARMRFDLVVNAMTRDAVRRGVIEVYGGRQRRPLLAVQEAAQLIARLALESHGAWRPGTYNVASENWTIEDLSAEIASITGAAIVRHEAASQDGRDYHVSSQRARDRLGFLPTRTVADSVREIAALLRSGRLKDPYAPRYQNAAR